MEIEGLASCLGRRGPLTQKVLCLRNLSIPYFELFWGQEFLDFFRPAARFLAMY